MRICTTLLSLLCSGIALLTSCSTLEKASLHGLNSGYYSTGPKGKTTKVYADVSEERIEIYPTANGRPDKAPYLRIPLQNPDSLPASPVKLKRQSLDIDITAILLKYRPSVNGQPPQLVTDLNIAMYAGWRFDNYTIQSRTDALGRRHYRISNFAYDIGIFAGPGTTPVNPFSTLNRTSNEYNGMTIQTGVAAFIESNMASFGLALGWDYLLNHDKAIWIYQTKPWVGFVVGIALN
jgi:hypothetical protein